MVFRVSPSFSTYGMLNYDHERSADYRLLSEGRLLGKIKLDLRYTIKKKADVARLAKLHYVESIGPDLVSDALRAVIERVAPGQAEFFDVSVSFDECQIHGFSAMNLTHMVPCVDMEKSEYQLTNFDPHNPAYSFLYTVFRDSFDEDVDIARCQEQPVGMVVNEAIKNACFDAKLKGLLFYRAMDMTHGDRTVCERIKG